MKIDHYPTEDQAVIDAWFSRKGDEHEGDCMDSERVARVGDEAEEIAYESIRSGACCGFDDDEIVGPSGARYLVGCNYGH